MALFNVQTMILMAQQRLPSSTTRLVSGSGNYNEFIVGIAKAIGSAIDMWQSSATLLGVTINGPVATGGRLNGPPLEPLILAHAPAGWDLLNRAVAGGFGTQFLLWQDQVRVPGLPWYPAFAAFPGPMAPPMPNVPCPLRVLAGPGQALIAESALAPAIYARLNDRRQLGAQEVSKAVAAGIDKTLQLWLDATIVQLVMGTGPIPSFAPPFVPVGPVINGNGTMMPGGLR